MSETQRLSSPLSSSPGHNSSLSRPNWPWSSPSLLRYSHNRSSQTSLSSSNLTQGTSQWLPPSSSSPGPSNTSASGSISWQSNPAARQHTGSTMGYNTSAHQPEESTRQWHSAGMEWVVRNVHKLRDFVEGVERSEEAVPEADAESVNGEDFEILSQSPILGDHKFKIEISRTPPAGLEAQPNGIKLQTLSLFVTLLMDFHPGYEMPVSIMVAIKCQDDRLGERGARPEWVWECWHQEFVFGQEREVWACQLPPLSSLIEKSRVKETDSMVICVQIHSPTGPIMYSQPSSYYVPRDLLDGLEASLDNPNTGDVKFICLERFTSSDGSPPLPPSEVTSPTSHRALSPIPSQSPFSGQTTARKRVIYAHSDILIRRSEYFATMLASSFAESQLVPGERKIYTILVEEADFETTYWLLKFCYANWLLFKEEDEPRAAVDGVGAGWSVRWLNAQGGEWDWKTFQRGSTDTMAPSGDGKSIASGDSVLSDRGGSPANSKGGPVRAESAPTPSRSPPVINARTTHPSTAKVGPSSTNGRQQPSTPRRSAGTSGSTMSVPPANSSSVRAKQVPIPLSVSTNYVNPGHYPLSPGHRRATAPLSTPDPHMHPTPPPPPASALSMYQVAHRYGMPGLSQLALEHMMSTITPQSSFALLLATSVWDEIRSLVEDYVVDKWDEVSVSEEFEQCCQEVAAGEWGTEGGRTLMAIFRRLRSPNSYSRT